MRITDAKMIVCSPGRNFVTLKVTTEDGIYGLGDATLNGRELAVASYLTDHVIPLLIGRDARRIEIRSAKIRSRIPVRPPVRVSDRIDRLPVRLVRNLRRSPADPISP